MLIWESLHEPEAEFGLHNSQVNKSGCEVQEILSASVLLGWATPLPSSNAVVRDSQFEVVRP